MAFGGGLGIGRVVGGMRGAGLARQHVFRPIINCVWSNLLLAPGFLVVLWVDSAAVAMIVTMGTAFLGSLGHPIQAAAVLNALPNRLRGMAAGLMATFFSFFGMGVGPLLVGVLSDLFAAGGGGVDALRHALSFAQLIFVFAALCAWRAYRAGERLADRNAQHRGASAWNSSNS
jgi:MFS family permease